MPRLGAYALVTTEHLGRPKQETGGAPGAFHLLCMCADRIAPGATLCEVEEQVTGLSHPLVGALLAHKWRFAVDTCEVIRLHHQAYRKPFGSELAEKVAIVRAADLIAHCAGHGDRAGEPALWEELLASLSHLSLPEDRARALEDSVVGEFERQSILG